MSVDISLLVQSQLAIQLLASAETFVENTYRILHKQSVIGIIILKFKRKQRLLDILVVECWLRVLEVPGSIPSQGRRHTKDVIKMVPVVPLFSTQY